MSPHPRQDSRGQRHHFSCSFTICASQHLHKGITYLSSILTFIQDGNSEYSSSCGDLLHNTHETQSQGAKAHTQDAEAQHQAASRLLLTATTNHLATIHRRGKG